MQKCYFHCLCIWSSTQSVICRSRTYIFLSSTWRHKFQWGLTFNQNKVIIAKTRNFISCFYSNTLITTDVDPHSDSLHNGKVKPKNRSSIIATEVQATTIETACMVIKSIITAINSLAWKRKIESLYVYTHYDIPICPLRQLRKMQKAGRYFNKVWLKIEKCRI